MDVPVPVIVRVPLGVSDAAGVGEPDVLGETEALLLVVADTDPDMVELPLRDGDTLRLPEMLPEVDGEPVELPELLLVMTCDGDGVPLPDRDGEGERDWLREALADPVSLLDMSGVCVPVAVLVDVRLPVRVPVAVPRRDREALALGSALK